MTTPSGRREPVISQAFHLRIPLLDHRSDVIVVLPARWIYEADWRQFLATLEAMRPGFVIPDDTATAGADTTGGRRGGMPLMWPPATIKEAPDAQA